MNFVGKILVVLIFVMSLVFMSFAVMVYATHKNWKEVVERKREDIKGTEKVGLHLVDDLKKENEGLQSTIEKLQGEIKTQTAAKQQALTELVTKLDTKEKELKRTITERDEFSDKEKKAVAALDTSSQNLKELTEEVGTLREEIRKAQEDRDTQFAKVVKLTDEVHKTQQLLAQVTERRDQLVGQISHARELLAQYDLKIDSALDRSPPRLRGKVLAINNEKMVEISLGSDDGLAVSHQVDVFRGTKYIGRLNVLTTTSDKAVAKIDTKYTKIPVQVGDDIATKLRVSDNRVIDKAPAAPAR